MRHYFKMKRNEWKVKAMLYGAILTVTEEHRDAIELLQKLYATLKDIPEAELKREFTEKLAEIIHTENQKKN